MLSFLIKAAIFAPPLMVAVILHEISHGYTAYRLGDPTAKMLGRLSLNPFRHVDPVMTLILPGLLILAGSPVVFGGAKPIPVNSGYFRNPRKGMMLVAAAGPLTNFFLAALSFLLLSLLPALPHLPFLTFLLRAWLAISVLTNLVLATFNLVPVPPLDGGRIAVGLLPRPAAIKLARLEPYGLYIVFLLLYTGVIGWLLEPLVSFALKYLAYTQG
jgi:Zn-dependent protease